MKKTKKTALEKLKLASGSWIYLSQMAGVLDCGLNKAGDLRNEIIKNRKEKLPRNSPIPTKLFLKKIGLTIDDLKQAVETEEFLKKHESVGGDQK